MVVAGRLQAGVLRQSRDQRLRRVAREYRRIGNASDHPAGQLRAAILESNGNKIAVSARIEEPHYRIYIMNADGSDTAPISQPANIDNVHPALSPDGHSIVFTSGTETDGALYIFDLS